eukprot:879914-Lingulodinium_polyedra.AAC.1
MARSLATSATASPGGRHGGLLRRLSMPLEWLGNPRARMCRLSRPPPTLTRTKASSGRFQEGT